MCDKLTHEDEVAEVDSLVELYVQAFLRSRDEEVGVEFLAELLDKLDAFLQAICRTTHTYVLPHDVAKLLVDRVNRTLTLDVHEAVDLSLNTLLCLSKLWQIGREVRPDSLVGKVVLDGVRQYEVTIGQALHKSRSTKTVGTVVREVTLTDSEQTCDRCLEFVVYPDTTHCVVDSRIDHHRVVVLNAIDFVGKLTRVNVGDLLVHVEEVAITLTDNVDAEAVD